MPHNGQHQQSRGGNTNGEELHHSSFFILFITGRNAQLVSQKLLKFFLHCAFILNMYADMHDHTWAKFWGDNQKQWDLCPWGSLAPWEGAPVGYCLEGWCFWGTRHPDSSRRWNFQMLCEICFEIRMRNGIVLRHNVVQLCGGKPKPIHGSCPAHRLLVCTLWIKLPKQSLQFSFLHCP